MEKLLLHLAASQLVQAVMSQIPLSATPVSGTVTDPNMARQILMCQLHVNAYEWLRNTLVATDWPTPTITSTWLSAAINAALTGGAPAPAPAPGTTVTPAPAGTVTAPVLPSLVQTLASIAPAVLGKALLADPHFQRMLKVSPANPTGK
jgi:hypothetical protein